MLTKITIRNFKRFEEAVIDLTQDLGTPAVLIGPNNSGITTAL
jgi:predicted ATP-dependent endonuclease of OLD family